MLGCRAGRDGGHEAKRLNRGILGTAGGPWRGAGSRPILTLPHSLIAAQSTQNKMHARQDTVRRRSAPNRGPVGFTPGVLTPISPTLSPAQPRIPPDP